MSFYAKSIMSRSSPSPSSSTSLTEKQVADLIAYLETL